jgi:hypothetical protein
MTDPVEPSPAPAPTEAPAPKPRRPVLPTVVGLMFLVLAASQAALWVRVLRPEPVASGPETRLQVIEDRLNRLETRPVTAPPDLRPLTARVTALEQRPAAAPATAPDGLADRVAADEARLALLEKAETVPTQVADRTARVARLQAAFAALAAGQPLGDIPQAPPALARYATAAPPTEPALRLAFAAASRAATAAGHPASSKVPLLERLWAEAQDLVTIRQGDHVLLGDPDAGVLAHARTALDAGDLAGAAAAVATLTGPAAQAMAPWLDQARGLLAARAALADLAAHA